MNKEQVLGFGIQWLGHVRQAIGNSRQLADIRPRSTGIQEVIHRRQIPWTKKGEQKAPLWRSL